MAIYSGPHLCMNMNKRGTVARSGTTPFPRANWPDESHATRFFRWLHVWPKRSRRASERVWESSPPRVISLKTAMATKAQKCFATFSSFKFTAAASSSSSLPSSQSFVLSLASSPIRTSRQTVSGVTNSKSGGHATKKKKRQRTRTKERTAQNGGTERTLTS